MYSTNKWLQFCKLLGLAPFSSNQHIQHALSVYGCLTVSILIVCTIFSFSPGFYGQGFVISSVVVNTVLMSVVIAHAITIIESVINRKEHETFLAKLKEVDDIFRFKLRYKVQVEQIRRKLVKKFCIVGAIIFTALLYYSIAMLTSQHPGGYFWNIIFSLVVTRIRTIQVTIYVELISFRFDALNRILKQIHSCRLYKSERLLDVDYRFLEHSSRILALKSAYSKLYDMVHCLNNAFGWSMLMIFLYYSVELICNFYWFFLILENILAPHLYFISLGTICPLLLLLSVYCYSCGKCVSKVHLTKDLIQKMFVDSSKEHVNYLLNDFLLQIYHQPIKFNAKLISDVDLKLLTSV